MELSFVAQYILPVQRSLRLLQVKLVKPVFQKKERRPIVAID